MGDHHGTNTERVILLNQWGEIRDSAQIMTARFVGLGFISIGPDRSLNISTMMRARFMRSR
ncbi:hypothetical protein A2U01_0092005, partial [Trifolium medium]|nr:hypothetical protein [Trifolium medium]